MTSGRHGKIRILSGQYELAVLGYSAAADCEAAADPATHPAAGRAADRAAGRGYRAHPAASRPATTTTPAHTRPVSRIVPRRGPPHPRTVQNRPEPLGGLCPGVAIWAHTAQACRARPLAYDVARPWEPPLGTARRSRPPHPGPPHPGPGEPGRAYTAKASLLIVAFAGFARLAWLRVKFGGVERMPRQSRVSGRGGLSGSSSGPSARGAPAACERRIPIAVASVSRHHRVSAGAGGDASVATRQ